MIILNQHLPADTYRAANRKAVDINRIIIHHSGGGIGGLLSTLNQRKLSYHYVILPSGKVWELVSVRHVAWHAGNANGDSIGIAFVGNFEYSEPTEMAYQAGLDLIAELEMTDRPIIGHREVSATVCPGMVDLDKLRHPKMATFAPWAERAWLWGISGGVTDGKRPNDPLTRQEAMVMLYRLWQMVLNLNKQ